MPDAVAAADVTKRKETTIETAEAAEIADAAEAEQKLGAHRARGIDMEVEMARRARAPMVDGIKGFGDRARRLSPLSAFGHGARHHAPVRAAVGKS